MFGLTAPFTFTVDKHGTENIKPNEGCLVFVNSVSKNSYKAARQIYGSELKLLVPKEDLKGEYTDLKSVFSCISFNPGSLRSLYKIAKTIRKGGKVLVMPEELETHFGGVNRIKKDLGRICAKLKLPIQSVYIDGLQHDPGAPSSKFFGVKKSFLVKAQIMPVKVIERTEQGDANPEIYNVKIYESLQEASYHCLMEEGKTLIEVLWEKAKRHGMDKVIAEDEMTAGLTYKRLFLGAAVLGKKMYEAIGKDEQHVGMLLPSSVGALVTFFGLQAYGKTCVMLNFTQGIINIYNALETAKVRTVVTSKRFIKIGGLESLISELEGKYEILYLEDLRKKIGAADKAHGLICSLNLKMMLGKYWRKPDEPAEILFTSGSENKPKGVVLTHRNILANYAQTLSHIDLNPGDVLMNILPMFHCFGLNVCSIMTLLSGIKTIHHPSPLQYKIIPKLIYKYRATIMVATNTFLQNYAKYSDQYELSTLRLVVAGGEQLKSSTAELYRNKFGIDIIQGYGVTECTPVISANSLVYRNFGTVGRVLPRLEFQLKPLPGIEKGGELHVRGPNVMWGYLTEDGSSASGNGLSDEWYNTGDIVEVDDMGFITIAGRTKRFVKIGGELVSLSSVEELASSAYPDGLHAAIATSSENKGEEILLVSNIQDMKTSVLSAKAKEICAPPILIPKKLQFIEDIPTLSTGKCNYIEIQNMLSEMQK